MKRIGIVVFMMIMMFCNDAYAQDGIRYGSVFGMNLSSLALTNGSTFPSGTLSYPLKIGASGGLMVDIPVSRSIYINCSILYSWRQPTLILQNPDKDVLVEKDIFTSSIIEIPAHLGYRFQVNDSFGILLDAGPSIMYRINRKFRQQNQLSNNKQTNTKEEMDGRIKRFDVGVGVSAGVDFHNKYRLSIGYDWGLLDVVETAITNQKYNFNNRNLYIRIAYLF